jgi:hypothetical protein
MEMDRRQWHVRWYFWSLGICDTFTEGISALLAGEKGTNLCEYLRVTLLLAPLIIGLHLVVYLWLLVCLTLIPIYLAGVLYTSFIAAVGALVLIVWLVRRYSNEIGMLIGNLIDLIEDWWIARQDRKEREALARAKLGPGFFEVILEYLASAKQKICPLIAFKQPSTGAPP